jgi:hypothetical protein
MANLHHVPRKLFIPNSFVPSQKTQSQAQTKQVVVRGLAQRLQRKPEGGDPRLLVVPLAPPRLNTPPVPFPLLLLLLIMMLLSLSLKSSKGPVGGMATGLVVAVCCNQQHHRRN